VYLLGLLWNARILEESYRNFTENRSFHRKNAGNLKNPAFQMGFNNYNI
jgi:hypothetical protein